MRARINKNYNYQGFKGRHCLIMSVTRIDDVMEDTSLVITDVGILSKKEKVPQTYTVVSSHGRVPIPVQ